MTVTRKALNNSIYVDCRIDSQRLVTDFAGRPENASAFAQPVRAQRSQQAVARHYSTKLHSSLCSSEASLVLSVASGLKSTSLLI